MHTCACEHPLVVFGKAVQSQNCVGAPACPLPTAEPKAEVLEWRSLVGTGIVFVSGATALIGALVHYLR
jgi:hypothetical protein